MSHCRLCVYLLLAAALPVVVGCVPIKNVVERWNASEVDGAVVGVWSDADEDIQMELRMHNDGYVTMHDPDDSDAAPEIAIRTFEQGDMGFILLVQYEAASSDFDESVVMDALTGVVLAYRVEGDEMVWIALRQEVLAAAIDAGEVAGELEDDEPVLDGLDDETVVWLAQAFGDEANHHEETLSFSRVDDD